MINIGKSLASLLFLAIMLTVGYQQTLAPGARSDSDLDYSEISRHIAVIAGKPHPMGGAANRDVRDYIVEHFESLGLATEVQKTTLVYRHPARSVNRTTIANVENIIARLPGKSPAAENQKSDLVVMAHYDSRPLTPGAADDASGTASIMEVARLMVNGPAPVRDVVFLITDGEEMGLLGAQAFFRQHPAAQRVGLVLNLEARGSYGASSMFETSENNEWLVGQLIEAAPDLVASSLSYEIYRRMPNDTDLTISRGEGIPGLNFGFISGLFDYHAMTDTPENLDKDSLAQQANYTLAATRHFSSLEQWQTGTGDSTYFNVWTGTLVSYSQQTAIIVGVLVLAFGVWSFVVVARAGRLRFAALGSGLWSLAILVIIVGSVFESLVNHQFASNGGIARLVSLGELPLLAYFVTTLGIAVWFSAIIRRGIRFREVLVTVLVLLAMSLISGRPWQDALILAVILFPSMLLLRNRRNVPDIWGAALLAWWLLTAVTLVVVPNASFVLVWPLASVLMGFVYQRRQAPADSDSPLVSTLASSFIPLLLLSYLVIMSYLALGSSLPQMVMIFVCLPLGLLWPLVKNVDPAGSGKPGLSILFAGVVMTLVVALDRDFDARHPAEESLFYAIDIDQQEAFWASMEKGSWSAGFLGDDVEAANLTRIIPQYDADVTIRYTDFPAVEAATLDITGDRLVDGQREISMHLQSPARAEYINLLFPIDMNISSAVANGLTVEVPDHVSGTRSEAGEAEPDGDDTGEPGWWRWRWYGLPENGAEIVLGLEPGRPVMVKIVEVDYGMPEDAPTRPVDSMARKYTWSDSVVIFQTRELPIGEF